jgi:hypothetical protein
MNGLQPEKEHEKAPRLRSLYAHRRWWTKLKIAISASSPKGLAALQKAWRRSWAGKVAWRWLRKEVEIVFKAAGIVTMSLWLKRLVEEVLGAHIASESILRGEMSDVVRDVEQEVEAGRTRHARRK